MLALLGLNNLKTYLIVIAIGVVVWLYKDREYQKSENIRQTENSRQLRLFDSLKYARQTYTPKELKEYLDYNRADLKAFLKKNDVRYRRIEQIITQTLQYRDTTPNNIDLNPILDAIRNNKSKAIVPVIDSTDCLIVKGYVIFEGDSLSLKITERKFTNKSDVVSYLRRNQWRFLGIKTRFLGKRQMTVHIKDDCGKSETFIINVKRK